MDSRDDRRRPVALLDVLRVWTPSLITIFGRAAETPPELIGAFALACGAAPLLLLLLLPRTERTGRGSRWCARRRPGGAARSPTAAGRSSWWRRWARSPDSGGWRSPCGRHARQLVPGLAWGLLLATTAHAALGTYGAVWRRDVVGVLELLVVVGSLVTALVAGAETPADEAPGRRAAWLVLPVLLLCGVVFANAGRAWAMAGTPGLRRRASPERSWRWPSPVARHVAAAQPSPRSSLVGLTALGTWSRSRTTASRRPSPGSRRSCSCSAARRAGRPGSRRAPSPGERGGPFAVAGGAVLWVVLLFVYYAGYDLGYRADVVLVGARGRGVPGGPHRVRGPSRSAHRRTRPDRACWSASQPAPCCWPSLGSPA